MESEIVQCPYDKSHMISHIRMPYHLIKCRKNFPTMDLAVCPFDASHEVKKAELKYHLLNCPNKVLLERELSFDAMLASLKGTDTLLKKGYTELPRYVKSQKDNLDEQDNWCVDINPRSFTRHSGTRPENHREEHNFRCPVSLARAAELSISSASGSHLEVSETSPKVVSDNRTFSLGWGRGRPMQSTNTDTNPPGRALPSNVVSPASLPLGMPSLTRTVGRGQREEYNLRCPVSLGRAAELSISSAPGNRQEVSVTSPQVVLDNRIFSLGWGRGRPEFICPWYFRVQQ